MTAIRTFSLPKALYRSGYRNTLIVLLALCHLLCSGQQVTADSVRVNDPGRLHLTSLIVPTVLLGYGIVGIESQTLLSLNNQAQAELKEHAGEQFTADDISQYVPFLTVYGLNSMGVQGAHSFRDRTLILGTAYLVMGITVNTLKHTIPVKRPDGVGMNSFPSGHTATAFMGAEYLMQEYKDQSIWYGVAGYAVAAGTGFLRMYNDRHWITDVAAGAGIGILSTKAAYWLYPWLRECLFGKDSEMAGVIVPYYASGETGLHMVLQF